MFADLIKVTLEEWWKRVKGQTNGNEFVMVGGGDLNMANAQYSVIPGGLYGKAYLYGMHSWAAGTFLSGVQGMVQGARLVARNTTVSNESATLFLDGASERLVLPNLQVWNYRMLITATYQSPTAPVVYGWNAEGVIRRQNSAASVALYGGTVTAVGGDLVGASTPVVTADTTNGALDITVTGAKDVPLYWGALVEFLDMNSLVYV